MSDACGMCEITGNYPGPAIMYLSWGGDTLDAGGGITLMRDARSRSGAELQAEEERRSLRRGDVNRILVYNTSNRPPVHCSAECNWRSAE